MLFWQIGKRINDEILRNKRAEYAKQIVSTLPTQLKSQYGRNFEIRNLRRIMQFAGQFTELETILPLSQQLSWSHLVELLPLKNQDAKLFYAQVTWPGLSILNNPGPPKDMNSILQQAAAKSPVNYTGQTVNPVWPVFILRKNQKSSLFLLENRSALASSFLVSENYTIKRCSSLTKAS
jgi:DUF1016 N-terminal domain